MSASHRSETLDAPQPASTQQAAAHGQIHTEPGEQTLTHRDTFETTMVYADGAFDSNVPVGAGGFTIQSARGNTIEERYHRTPGTTTSVETEAETLLMAVQTAKQYNPSHIVAYSDCKPVIEKVNEFASEWHGTDHTPDWEYWCQQPYRALTRYRQIAIELTSPRFVTLKHIPRSRNSRADHLATQGLKQVRHAERT